MIRRHLPDGEVKLADLAPQLHMSARTLQRRLGEWGTSLQAELDEVRRQQALYFLEGGTAIAELSSARSILATKATSWPSPSARAAHFAP